MDDVSFGIGFYRSKQSFRGNDIIILVICSAINPSDLGARTRSRHKLQLTPIGLNDINIGMQSTQDRRVGRMLINGNDRLVPLRFKTRAEVLADEAGRTGDRNSRRHSYRYCTP